MPAFLATPFLAGAAAWIGRIIATRGGYWVLSAVAFFGIQLVATKFLTAPLMAQIQSAFNGAPATIVQWLAFLNIDVYVTIVMSAYVTAAAAGALRLRRTGGTA